MQDRIEGPADTPVLFLWTVVARALRNRLITLMKKASAYAPGRVELLGNHTDYNQGVVLAAAIDRGLTMSGIAQDADVIGLSATLIEGRVRTSVSNLRPRADQRWANYPLGVVQQFVAAGHKI